jgi:DNA-directed RNA polymerase
MVYPEMDEQLRLEDEMRADTRSRYFRNHEKAEQRGDLADTHVGRSIFDHLYHPFLEGIEEWIAKVETGAAGRKARAYHMVKDFGDTRTMAYIFVKSLINTTLTLQYRDKKKIARLTRVALAAAGAIHDELRMRYFEDQRKPLLRKIVQDFQKKDLPRRRRRELMIKQFHTQQLEWEAEGWDQTQRLKLGLQLLDIFKITTGTIEYFEHYEGKRSINCVSFTGDMVTVIGQNMENSADLFTVYYPTVVPPRPWSNGALIGGGYYSDFIRPYRFIKGAKTAYLRELENRDLSKVIEPINAIQNTAWRIKPSMVEVLDAVFSMNIRVQGLPTADPIPIPKNPPGMEEDEELFKDYRRTCYLVHEQNRRDVSKRISVLRTIGMARKFSKYPAIYFPMDLDSRGRVYPKVPFLNPQGPDYVKGLLEFAEGKPIENETHAAYLAIAIANAWGKDKLPLQERVDWVEENEEMLIEVAQNPLQDYRWIDADEPFMALRGAMEWAEFCEQGWGFMSHMPVHFDATCSGLQHFSALLRDAEGGRHVNLMGLDERQDIYAEVARKATRSLEHEANTCDIAKLALSMGISRSLCKRPVMIVPYAGTFMACMEYVNDHYRERAEAGEALPVELTEIRSKIAPLVAKHVWAAIGSTVIAAREAMEWINATARLACKDNDTPIQWTTPDGFVVQQAKYEEKTTKVSTFLDGGRRIQSRLTHPTNVLDSRRMAQSLSPNYIHSLDAAHMRMSVRRAEGMGLSFAMIHDSFGVHASDMDRFVHECIKPAFVEMYERGDNLEIFKDELLVNIKDHSEVPPLPSKGDLDIYEVLDSQFFFS